MSTIHKSMFNLSNLLEQAHEQKHVKIRMILVQDLVGRRLYFDHILIR